LDESGFMLQPVRRRTWAPRGQTPIQRVWDRHDRWSVISALTLSPNRRRIGFWFDLHDQNIKAPQLMEFLRELRRQTRRKMIVVCDRYSVHRSALKQLLASGCTWLQMEWLPAYAPDLNPVEAVWQHIKHAELANFIPNDKQHLFDVVADSLDAIYFERNLKRCFFDRAELSLE